MPNFSLRNKIFTYYALLIIVIFIACSISLYVYMVSFAKNVVGDYALNTIQQTNLKLDSWMREIESISKTIMWNGTVHSLLVDYSGAPEDYLLKMEVSKYLTLLTVQRDDIYSISLLKDSRFVLKHGNFFDSETEDQKWIRATQTADSSYQAGNFTFFETIHKKPNGELVFAGMRKIYDKYTFGTVGDMIIELNYNRLAQFMNILDSKNKLHYLVDRSGNILYSTKPEEMGGRLPADYWKDIDGRRTTDYALIKDDQLMVAYTTSAYTGWSIVSVTPLNEIVSPFQQMQRIFLIVNAIGITVALILAAWLSRSITSPLNELMRKIKLVRLGNLKLHQEPEISQSSYNEIERLNYTFSTMLADIDRMIEEVYEAKLKQTETELKVLRAQINPHFLYNTLDIINWKLIINEQKEISSLVRALSAMLRYNINESDKPVQIREELAQIQNYLEIQRARFGDSVQLQVRIEPEVLQLSVCKFILQPIVENCLIHGFKAKQQGMIVINGRLDKGNVILEVIDNGNGMTQSTVDSLNSQLDASGKSSTGIGIHNVNERIKLIYGGAYQIRIESHVNEGTKVTVTLPAIRQPLILENPI